ncbi:MAG: CBS domain-containing protein [Rhodospirillales bacterium]|nr:CBS domain-containing protein [Rhodospirillales bacterium]
MRVRDFARPRETVLTIRPGTPCADIVARLTTEKVSCAIIVDAGERPIGILTERDVARRIAFRVPPEAPVETVMTAPVLTIERREYLYCAIAWMRRHDLRHMPVVDRTGRLAGMLYLHDALAAASDGLMRQIDRLSRDDTVAGMREVKSAQVELAEELFADHLPAFEIQRLLTRINCDIYRRIGEAGLRTMAAEGWGEPPGSAATIVMGSGGREENFLFPDQDNGFIVSAYPDTEHSRVDAFFIELAERMCRDLNAVGIPYCNGYCMAVNPLWRKTLPQWIAQIRQWTSAGSTVAIRLADIFFDFQSVWGDTALARELRHAVTGLVRNNRTFLRQMYQDKVEHSMALGLFGGFVHERRSREYRGQVNLKYTGTLPLVSSVRLLALREGIEATPTLERIAALTEKGVFERREAEELSSAFGVVTDTLLRQQLADFRAGRRTSYFIDPQALDKRTRSALLAALKSIHGLRRRTHLEFAAQVF